MGEDREDRFELPRKFQRGVIRRERCDRAEVEAVSTTRAGSYVHGTATWRTIDLVVAESGVAAAVRDFADSSSAVNGDFARTSWGRHSVYDSQVPDSRWPLMLRLLDLVRSASDEEYAEAIAVAEKMREEYPAQASRAAMSVLALDRPEWCSADIADYSADDDRSHYVARLLMLATTTREQARELGVRIRDWMWVNDDRRAEGTFLNTIDAGADEFLIGCLEGSRWHALNLLPKLPSERAVEVLIGELGPTDAQAALLEAAKRFPRRVLRLLAEAEPATQVDYVLRLHVAANPEVARSEVAGSEVARPETSQSEVPQLSEVARQRVGALLGLAESGASAIAAHADLPRVLVIPPWEDPELGKPTVLKHLPAPEPFFHWPSRDNADRTTTPEPAPSPDEAGDQAKIAQSMAEWLNSEYEPYAEAADAFFRRYPAEVTRQLLPRALGPLGPDRKTAEVAVRFAAREGLADVMAVAAEFGPEAERATQTLLDRRGLDAFPKSMPAVPLWADAASLPGILLAGRQAALPASAVAIVVNMLTISSRREVAPYGGIEIVTEACDAESLAEFAWGLFENWAAAGYPTKKLGWAFDTLLWFGDVETARRLAPLVWTWPGEGGSARAATALDVLLAIGGEEGLREVYDISQRSSFSAQRVEGSRRIAKVAARRGLSADQLEDQLVLDLGVGADATLTLDFGARQFTVGFDDYLQPYVTDDAGGGKRRSALPKPTAKDDPALAATAHQRFAELKKDAKTFAMRQAARLELAMVSGRKWTGAGFQALFIGHPLLRLLGRRLVWGEFDGTGALRAAFRIAEDGTLADVADEQFTLSPGIADGTGTIGLVHPVVLGSELPRWSEIFHDYEIVQPFPQVGRPVFALTTAEREATRLDRFCGAQLPTDRFLALDRATDWGTARRWESGRTVTTGRQLPGDRTLMVRISPGYSEGRLADTPEQTITDIWLCAGDNRGQQAARPEALPLGELDAVLASEILADLAAAVGQ